MLYSRFLLVTHLKYSSVFIYIAESLHCSLETITTLLIGYTLIQRFLVLKKKAFPGGLVVKNPCANAGDLDLIPRLGKSPGGEMGTPMDRGTWWATVHGVAKKLHMTERLNMHTQST